MLCVVSTERCVTQVPEFGYNERIGVGACDRGPSGLRDTGEDGGAWERGNGPVFRVAEKAVREKGRFFLAYRVRIPYGCLRLWTQRRFVYFRDERLALDPIQDGLILALSAYTIS